MRNEQPGMSPRPKQHPSFNEMQLWQKHLMYKQLQELQRQQQLQQLDQGARQQNSLSQLSAATNQAVSNELPPLLNGMPISEASNYMWTNDIMGGESKTPSNSQMFISGSTNFAQSRGTSIMQGSNGFMLSNDQGQAVRTLGFVPQQLDQSLYGTPVSSSRVLLDRSSQFQGMSHDCTDAITKADGNQTEKTLMQSSPFNSFQNNQHAPEQGCLQDGILVPAQGFQGKSMFGNASIQSLSSGVIPGNFQQSVQVQEFQDRQEQAVWSGNLQDKMETVVGPSHGVTSLDPTEEKILFGTDDDGNWGAAFGSSNVSTGDYLQGNPSGNNDYFSAFPSVQSGSWSALMQEAVQASSSDKGLQEEWSGLSFQKTEPPIANQSAVSDDIGKHQATWEDSNLQRTPSLTSRPFPLFSNADSGQTCHTTPSFQHSIRTAYEQNVREQSDASHETSQQSSKGAQSKHFDQHDKQKQLLQGLQAQMHYSTPNGGWAGKMYDQSVKPAHSADMNFSSQNNLGIWTRQKNVPLSTVSSQPSTNSIGWKRSLPSGGDGASEVHDHDDRRQHAQGNDVKGTVHMERNFDESMSKAVGNCANSTGEVEPIKCDFVTSHLQTEVSSMGNFVAAMNSDTLKANQEIPQQILNNHQVDFGKHTAFGSFVKSRGAENVGKYQHQPNGEQAWESSVNITDKGSHDAYSNKQELPKVVSNEGYTSNRLHPGLHNDLGRVAREHLLIGNEPSPTSGGEKSSGLSGQKVVGPHRFQYDPMGNLGMNMEHTDSSNYALYSQGLPQSLVRGYRSQDQGNIGNLQFTDHIVSNMGKGQSNDLQANIKAAEEVQSRGTTPSHGSPASASFDGSSSEFFQNKKIVHTSQNMLELLHKVDQSRDNSTPAHLSYSEQNTTHEILEKSSSDGSALPPQHHQSSSLQGFGLRLGPPSQRQPISNHAVPSQASTPDSSTRLLDSYGGDKDQTQSTSTASPHHAHPEASQMQNQDSKSNLSRQTSVSFTGNQLQLQQQWKLLQQQKISSMIGHKVMDQSLNLSSGNQADVEEHAKYQALLRQAQDSHGRLAQDSHGSAVADQSVQTSLHSSAGRIPPFRLASSAGTHSSASQFYSPDTSYSQPTDSGFYQLKGSGQQLPVVETRSVLRPSASSGMSRQVGFSNMVHNVWTNVSAQQHLSGVQPHKLIPSIPQSMNLSASSRETNSRSLQKAADQGNKGGSAPSEFGTYSINTQQFGRAKDHPVKDDSLQQMPSERADFTPTSGTGAQGQEQVPTHNSDGNSAASLSSSEHPIPHDAVKGKHVQDSYLKSNTERFSLPNFATSNSGAGFYGHTVKPSDIQQPNYSLLQQMQAMKGADSDMSRQVGKRLKGADFNSDSSQMEWKAGQRYIYGQNTVFRVPPDGEPGSTSQSSFPSDVKMLSFSLRENEEKTAGTTSHLLGRDVSSHDIYASGQHDVQNQTQSLSISSTTNFMGKKDHPQFSPQVAPSWFEQYGKYKNGQILAMYDGHRSLKAAPQQFFSVKGSERMDGNTLVEQRIETSQFATAGQSTSTDTVAVNELCSHRLALDIRDHDMVLRPKKRKSETLELLPWHKEVTLGSQRLQSISMAELDWARSANRLTMKVEDEADMIEDGALAARPRRRLILTTQLMQQLLPSVPAAILAAELTSAYESVTYILAKSTLGDACSLMSCSRSDSFCNLDRENRILENGTSDKKGEHFIAKVLENFIGRSRKLESDFSRLDKRTSILDVRLEWQELERFSLINRLGKFHGRNHTDGADNSSASEAASRKSLLQRHVTALPMPRNLPEGVLCLSL